MTLTVGPRSRYALISLLAVCLVVVLVVAQAKVVTWLGCIVVLAMAMAVATSGRPRRGSTILAGVAAVLFLLEIAGNLDTPVFEQSANLAAPRLVVGWGPDHAGSYTNAKIFRGRKAFDVAYTIDNDLFRAVASGASGPGVAFLGDAFVFGYGLPDAQTLPQRFADLEDRTLPVYNLGMNAYSPAQVLATMQSGIADGVLRRSELLVQFVAASWHAPRTACNVALARHAPRYVLSGKVLHFAGECELPRGDILEKSRFFKNFVKPMLSKVGDGDVALMVAITSETIRLAREKYHVPMIVYYQRDPAFLRGTRWTDERIVAALRAAGADVLDYDIPGDDGVKYTIPDDPHPNAAANIIHARVLAAHIRQTFPDLAAAKALEQASVARR